MGFQNFLLLMGVIFGIQFVDRTLGPILPLFVADLGIAFDQVPLVSGVLFSAAAGAAALGNTITARLLFSHGASRIIAGCAATGAAALALMAAAQHVGWLVLAAPVLGLSVGVGMTAAYTAAGREIPPRAQGVGFGFLTSASLVGLALSPVVSGALAVTSIRAVFALDLAIMAALAVIVPRLMVEHG
jgi:MFS family permease